MTEYWLNKWKAKDISWDQTEPNRLLLNNINRLHLAAGATIFVPLCGKSVDMLWLAKQKYRVIGVEISLEAAELFFTEHHIAYQHNKENNFDVLSTDNITLLVGNFFDLDKSFLGPIDAIYDKAAYIALEPLQRQQYAQKMLTLITDRTQILLLTITYNEAEMQGPPFSVSESEIKQFFGKQFSILQLSNEEVVIIPLHLQAKGLKQLYEQVYYLVREG